MKYIILGFWNLLLYEIRMLSKKNRILYDSRLKICQTCKYINDDFCDLCGCYVKAKTKYNYKLDINKKSINGCPKKYW